VAHIFGAWGALPAVVPLFAIVAARLGALAFAHAPSRLIDRAVAGVVLAFAAAIGCVRLLGLVGGDSPVPLIALLVAVAALLLVVGRSHRFFAPGFLRLGRQVGLAAVPLALAGVAALCIVVVAARWLPVWQWDSLGYHLPFVHFTLAAGGSAGVPRSLEYIGTYPHDVELFFVALRACLPDDRLIDLGQVPFGVAGAIVTGAISRRAGATVEIAVAAGAAWLVVPAVFLQLPTNYVDVGTAAFLLAAIDCALAPPTTRSIALGGVALGLFVGSKPNAPLAGAVLFGLLLVRGVRAGHGRAVLVAAAAVVVLGGESYITNFVTRHNPVWPVRLDLGPLHLPGRESLHEVLSAGAAAPHLHGSLPSRFVRSLFSLTSPPVFDMRYGGFGPVFLVALPFALFAVAARRSPSLAVAFAATLLSPDPAIARYVLAFPALVLATAAPSLDRRPGAQRIALGLLLGGLAAWQLVYATPGLSGEGPPPWSYARMTDDERALAVGADGRPLAIDDARRRVGAGEAFAFDENMDLCDQAWDVRQSYRVILLPADLGGDALDRELGDERVRVMAVGDLGLAGVWAAGHPLEFERLSILPSCRKGSCSVFVRR